MGVGPSKDHSRDVSARATDRCAKRALERQLDYIRAKAERLNGKADTMLPELTHRSQALRKRLEMVRPIGPEARVLEVGSGVTGHIFFFGATNAVGIDPLADHFQAMFPRWQSGTRTIAIGGESLPFRDGSFDIILSDNVVDHAEQPARIVAEMARVLAPGGLIYFTVNVHHPFYNVVARLHRFWQSLGLPGEIGPFADHTVHLTPTGARRLFEGLPFQFVSDHADVEAAKRIARETRPRHVTDRLKRLCYKNAVYEVIALREG